MKRVKTYSISLPLNENDYNFLSKYIDNPEVGIDDEIKKAYVSYKSKLNEIYENKIFDHDDYPKFIKKLKEKQFIEQFENGFGDFNINKFYSSLEKHLRKEKILFDKNYDTTEEQAKIIGHIVEKILKKYFNDDNPRWLIRAYIVGRAIYSKEKYKSAIPPITKLPLSNEAKKIAKINSLPLEVAKRIDVALDYSNTTIKCLNNEQLKNLRKIIIDENIIKGQSVYKVVNKIREILPRGDVFLLNIDWHSALCNELNYIANRTRLELRPSNSYIVCVSFQGCCDDCSKDIVGRVFKISEAPQIPYEKCCADICLCNLIPFNPEYQYISLDGQTKLKVENEKEWEIWYQKNIVLSDATKFI